MASCYWTMLGWCRCRGSLFVLPAGGSRVVVQWVRSLAQVDAKRRLHRLLDLCRDNRGFFYVSASSEEEHPPRERGRDERSGS